MVSSCPLSPGSRAGSPSPSLLAGSLRRGLATPWVVPGAHTEHRPHPTSPFSLRATGDGLIPPGKAQGCGSSLQSRQHPQLCQGQTGDSPGQGRFSPREGLERCPQAGPTGTGLFQAWSFVWLCLVPRVLECKVPDTTAQELPAGSLIS